MDKNELKHKLRQLKKLEEKIRFSVYNAAVNRKYIWMEFFSTKSDDCTSVRYSINTLLKLNKEQLKEVYEEYFYCVYFQLYKESGLTFDGVQDLSILGYFGLQPGADVEQIKSRFKELAKKYHPDHGGSSEKMIEILEAYHKAINNNK